MKPDEIARLRELLGKATPGPWEMHDCINYGDHYLNMTGGGSCNSICSNDRYGDNETPADNDMRLIAAAVNALPALLALAEAVMGAATGEVVEVGNDEEGQPRVLIHSTREELMRGPALPFKRVRLVALPDGEA